MSKLRLVMLMIIHLFVSPRVYTQIKKPLTPVQQLFSHLEKVIPDVKKYCEKGCTNEEILQFESKIGYKLPDAVKEFYKTIRPNKIYGLAYGWGFMNLANDVSSIYEPYLGNYIDNPDKIKTFWNSKARIPVIEDGGGSTIYLDLDPNTNGSYGQLILKFRDYPEIVFSVAKDFESFIIFLNTKFEKKQVTGYVDERKSIFLEIKDGGGSDYSNWVSMSHNLNSEDKNRSNEPLSIDSTWQKSLKESGNGEFIVGRGTQELKKSDTDRIYYLLLRDENLTNLEPLTLFPKIAKVSFYLQNSNIPTRLWEILEKTRITDIDFIVSSDSTIILDFKNFTRLHSLSNLNLQAGHTSNIDSISGFQNLKCLRINQMCDLKFLSKTPNLTSLQLEKEGKNYQNWEAISTLKELRYLQIPSSNFSDLGILINLKNLTSLNVGNNEFKDYTVFEKFPTKMWLYCSYDCFEKIFDIAVKRRFTISPVQYKEPTPKQNELYEKYRKIRETW